MIRLSIAIAAAVLAAAPVAAADPVGPVGPQISSACTTNVEGSTTQSPDGGALTLCQNGQWQPVAVPAAPSDRWASFTTPLTLHGQGMQNPGVLAGSWTATPLNGQTQCRAVQQTVLVPGTLSKPQVAQGEPNSPLTFEVMPTAFTVEFSGDCLWVRH